MSEMPTKTPIKTQIKAGGSLLKHAAGAALDTILPPRCVLSGEMVDQQGMVSPDSWAALDFIHDPLCSSCGAPFGYEIEQGTHCAICIDYPPSFDSARSALKYNDQSRKLILGFKHADKTHGARAFVPWLKMAGREMLEDADALIPVPLHRWRLLKRRYNQAAIIAHYLAKETNIGVMHEALIRTRYTPIQGHLNYEERRKNVRKAFIANPKYEAEIKGKTLVLIDDVYTTGATVKECTKVLRKAGAKKIHILTLARTVKFED